MSRSKGRQVFLREFQQSHCRPQTPAVLWMRWLFEIFLQMNKCTGGLNEPLEHVVITRPSIQPKLLQDIVRIVVTFLIPAAKIRVVKWVLWDFDVLQIGICAH